MASNEPNKLRIWAAAIAAAAALAIGVSAANAHAATSKAHSKPVISSVHVKAATGAQRVVMIATVGRPFQHVTVCDLRAVSCVSAERVNRKKWRAVLATQDANGSYRIGVIARSGNDYVTKSLGNAPAAAPFMP